MALHLYSGTATQPFLSLHIQDFPPFGRDLRRDQPASSKFLSIARIKADGDEGAAIQHHLDVLNKQPVIHNIGVALGYFIEVADENVYPVLLAATASYIEYYPSINASSNED